MAASGRIKGAVLREFVLWCEQHDDRERLGRALRALDRGYPGTVDPGRSGAGVLASQWYPAELVHVLVDAVTEGRPQDELDAMAVKAARDIMGHTLSGIYKFLFSTFARPELYAKHVNKLWSLHYDSGHVQIDLGEGVATAHVTRWSSHHPFICKMNSASSGTLYGAMGCTQAQSERMTCIAAGAPECSWVTRWSA